MIKYLDIVDLLMLNNYVKCFCLKLYFNYIKNINNCLIIFNLGFILGLFLFVNLYLLGLFDIFFEVL